MRRPCSRTLASGSEKGEVFLWDVNTSQQLFALPGQYGRVHDLAFTPDGKSMVSLADQGMRGEILLWSGSP